MAKLTSRVLAEPVLVGRERELEELMRCLDLAFEGKGTTVFVSGEAGSGKTRLVKEFLGMVKQKEIVVLSSWCLSDLAVPYFPFMGAFDAYFKAKTAAEEDSVSLGESRVQTEQTEDVEGVKAWLLGPKQAGKSERLENLTPQAWQDLAVAAVARTLLSISARKVVVLFIDDLQWADSASLSLLHYISRSIGSARVLVLATYRSEELSPDAEGRPHPLLETLRLMRREDVLREIKLLSLGPVDVAVLAEKMVGGSLHPEFSDKLAEESQGNPLFVVESLRMLFERGSLVQDGGRWRLSIDEVGIPAKIRDIILRRVGMLKPSQRRTLDLASVIGEKFDVELLGAVLGQDNLDVLETLTAIGKSSSLVICEGNFYKFDHAKSRDAVYEEIPQPLRMGYHAKIAEKMEARSRGARDLPVNDLAYHYAQAGNREKSVEYALAAGEDALARFSNSEAAKQFTYVLNTVSETPEHADERAIALEGLGDALTANSLYAEAIKKYEQLHSVAESGVVKLRALRKAVLCSFWNRDWAHALEMGRKAEEYAQVDRLEYARLRVHRGFITRTLGRRREAFEDSEEALRVFEEEFSLRDVASALVEILWLYMGEDRLEDTFAAGLRSLALYEELGDLRGQMLAHDRLSACFCFAGFSMKARYNGEEAFKIAEEVGDYNMMSLGFYHRAMFYEDMGDYRAAVEQSLKGAECAEKTEAYYALNMHYNNIVRQYAVLGETERAEEFVKKIERLYQEVPSARSDGHFDSSKAFLFTARGQWREANELFERGKVDLPRFEGGLGSLFDARVTKGIVWSLEKQGRVDEAKRLLEETQKVEEKLLGRLEHANVQAYLMARRDVGLGEELNIRLDLVNVSKKPAALVRVEGLIPPDFKANALPPYCSVQNGAIQLNGRELCSFTVETVKLKLQATKAGVFTLTPQVIYIDETGKTKTSNPNLITVTVHPMLHAQIGEETISVPVLPGRVATGFTDLDVLLYGGIPENHAVVLTSSPSEERELLTRRFLETGTTAHAATIYLTTEPGSAKALAKNFPSEFFLFVCNPRADAVVESLPNVFKFKGVENLTEIDIAFAKVFRMLNPSKPAPKRACIDILSDVLLQHHAVTTRKWLSGLLADLRAKGFTTLATINPKMHTPEEVQAILGLFDGEINISEKETAAGLQQTLRIRKLFNQKYLENELILNRERLE